MSRLSPQKVCEKAKAYWIRARENPRSAPTKTTTTGELVGGEYRGREELTERKIVALLESNGVIHLASNTHKSVWCFRSLWYLHDESRNWGLIDRNAC